MEPRGTLSCMASCTRSLLLASLLGSLSACSSSDFAVAPSDSASDGGGAGDSSAPGNDAAIDTAPADPCAPEDGVAKFCVDVALEREEHPSYDASSGATGLGIDGNGIVYAYLYAKDPGASTGPKPSPVALLQYPPPEKIGQEVNVDTGLPLTLTGQAPPGEYWIVAGFQDNKTRPRTAEIPALAGDFVVVPGATREGNAIYPKMRLELGKTARAVAKLKPYREVSVSVRLTLGLNTEAGKPGSTIHGDGPILFAVYDGELSTDPSTATVLSADIRPCIDTMAGSISPGAKTVFGTTVDGEHKLLAALFDYQLPTEQDGPNPFPGVGTLLSPLVSSATLPIPKVNISSSSWVSTAEVSLDSVPFPSASTAPDPFTCPPKT